LTTQKEFLLNRQMTCCSPCVDWTLKRAQQILDRNMKRSADSAHWGFLRHRRQREIDVIWKYTAAIQAENQCG